MLDFSINSQQIYKIDNKTEYNFRYGMNFLHFIQYRSVKYSKLHVNFVKRKYQLK